MKMKKILSLLICITLMGVLFCSCSEDLERETYEKQIEVSIEAEPTSIAMLEPELLEIAKEHDEDCELVGVYARYNKEQIVSEKGILAFTFVSEVEDKNRVTVVTVTYDMDKQQATEVSFDEGNGHFSDQTDEPIEESVKYVAFSSLFEQIRNDASMNSKLSGTNVQLTIDFTQKIECKVL